LRPAEDFPVEAIKDAFFKTLCDPKPLVLSAPTGSGKSTRLPLWFAQRRKKVLVVEPRRIACRSLSHFLKSQTDGEEVAHRIRFESTQTPKSKILFVTPGMALNMLAQKDPFLEDGCAIILDEFHERSAQADLFLALMLKKHQHAPFPLILASATLDVEHLKQKLDANFIHAEGRMYDIALHHRPSPPAPSGEDLAERVYTAVEHALKNHEGEILVFLPGKGEIARCAQILKSLKNIECFSVHGGIDPQVLARLFSKASVHRRVYLATNVAETSLTLPGVRVVIDSGLVRMRVHRAGQSTLTLIPAALSSMTQRMGRAGRVNRGVCYRLFAQTFKAKAQTQPELLRVELDALVLDAMQLGLSLKEIKNLPFVDSPPEFALAKAFAKLNAIGACSEEGVTPLGKELGSSPVDANHALLILQSPEPLRFAMCVLVSVLQTRGVFEKPMPSDEEIAAREVRAGLDPTRAQMHALLFGKSDEEKLDSKKLQNAKKILTSICAFFKVAILKAPILPSAEALSSIIAKVLPESAFAMRTRAQNFKKETYALPYGNGSLEILVAVEDYRKGAPYGKEKLKAPSTLLVLSHAWFTDARGRVCGRSGLTLPVSADTLVEVGACDAKVANAKVVGDLKGGKGKVVAELSYTLGGRVLATKEQALFGEDLCHALVGLSFEGRLRRVFPKLQQSLEEAFHWSELYARFDLEISLEAERLVDLGCRAFLFERFRGAGLEDAQEIALLGPDDLVPNVIPSHALLGPYDDVREAFPLSVEVSGARYDVSVWPSAKKVEITPANKKAKSHQLKRKELPRFKGFRVEHVQASRRVVLR